MAIESLEDRRLFATSSVIGGTLFVLGTNQSDIVTLSNDGTTFSVTDGVKTATFASATVQRVNVFLGNGDDRLNAAGLGVDVTADGGNGNDIITLFGPGTTGNNVIIGGNGDDNLWGGTGPSDNISGGNGDDIIYDIVGGTNTIDAGHGFDRVIARATDSVAGGEKNVAFGSTTAPVAQVGGVVYVNGTANDDTVTINNNPSGGITVNFNGASYSFTSATYVAGVLGAGNDTMVNNTSVDDVFYGAAGNDTLVGGYGFNLLKGGNDNDTLVGRGTFNDLSGDAGVNIVIGSNVQR